MKSLNNVMSFEEWKKENEIDLSDKYCTICLEKELNDEMAWAWKKDEYFINCDIADGNSKDTCPYLEDYLKDKYEEYLWEVEEDNQND